jgi:phage-related minor tail protein
MKNLHNIFKKVSGNASNLFKKATEAGDNVFKKVSDVVDKVKEQGPGIANQISEGAQGASKALNRVSKISGKIGSSPITAGLPFGQSISAGANALASAAKLASQGAGKVSEISDLKNYKKGGVNKQLENIRDVQQRTRELNETGNKLGRVFV